MINNGVPQPIIQRYLGHTSPEMTNRYAQIHDQTMKKEYAKYTGRKINISGQVVEEETHVDVADLQWMKKNILAQTLPNGYCGLPMVAGSCPHANACLACSHFRTDASFLSQHKAQLAATEEVLEVARANNWNRQIDMNTQVRDNLKKIIIALEPVTP
jgi:integrase/recombinase XerD